MTGMGLRWTTMAKLPPLDESWQRFPEARIRMRADGVNAILEGLENEGFCVACVPHIHLVEEGIYVDILLNTGKHGSIVALPLEILIPAKMLEPKKKGSKEKNTNEVSDNAVVSVTDDDLRESSEEKEDGLAPGNDGMQES